MKRTERHHLKENEVAEWMLQLREQIEANRQVLTYIGLGIVVVALAVFGTLAWRSMTAGRANAMLAEAMTMAESPVTAPQANAASGNLPVQPAGTYPTEKLKLEAALPKFVAVADAYPGSPAGLLARYQAGSILVALGRIDEGIKAYRIVAEQGTGVVQAMAKLGIADANLAAGKYDEAIKDLKAMSAAPGEDVPADGVLMQLARAYVMAGNAAEAKKSFQRVVDEFPQSAYASEARKELDAM
jgi:TolA-binding protein